MYLLHTSLTILKSFQNLLLPWRRAQRKLTGFVATPVLPPFRIMRVPFCLGGRLKSPALPEGLSRAQKGNWSEMASHMLATLPECFSLATLCMGKGWPATLLFSPALSHVTCARQKCYLSSSIKALVWLAGHPSPLKNMKPSLSSSILACFKRIWFPFFS